MAEFNDNYESNALFSLEIDDISIMSFEKVTFGDSEFGVIEGRTGIDPHYKQTSSGLKMTTDITIEKHLREGQKSEVLEITDWHQGGSKDRRSGAVVIHDRLGTEVIRFNFKDAWVSKASYPELDANQENNPVVFTFTLSVGEIVPE